MTVMVHPWMQILEASQMQIIAFCISQIQIPESVFPGRNDTVTFKTSNGSLQLLR